jgi:hypothetical protein
MKPRIHQPVRAEFEPTEQQIQHAAHLLWEEAGKPTGRDREIWFAAKERLKHRAAIPAPAPRGPSTGDGLSEKSVQAIVND